MDRIHVLDERFGDCKRGNHQLQEVQRTGYPMYDEVVHWCSVCGAITVDLDYDGRTRPGRMKGPSALYTGT